MYLSNDGGNDSTYSGYDNDIDTSHHDYIISEEVYHICVK